MKDHFLIYSYSTATELPRHNMRPSIVCDSETGKLHKATDISPRNAIYENEQQDRRISGPFDIARLVYFGTASGPQPEDVIKEDAMRLPAENAERVLKTYAVYKASL